MPFGCYSQFVIHLATPHSSFGQLSYPASPLHSCCRDFAPCVCSQLYTIFRMAFIQPRSSPCLSKSTCFNPIRCSLHDHYASPVAFLQSWRSLSAVHICARLRSLLWLRVCHGFCPTTIPFTHSKNNRLHRLRGFFVENKRHNRAGTV